jgi:ABC-type glycerol-3-phosphate transport system substrate-binding protein
MRHKTGLAVTFSLLLSVMLGACAGNITTYQTGEATGITPTATPTQILTVSRSASLGTDGQTIQNTPVVQATPEKITIRVWWSDELYPQTPSEAEDILTEQFDGFRLTYTLYDLDVRRKRTSGLGGILPTLRTAGPVAPGALPDLTLMRRADLLTAATEGLIVPLDTWIPADLADDNLLPGTRALGEIDGVLYGIPYALNLYHSIYRASVFEEPPLSFDDVLTQEPVYLFPAGTVPVNWTLLLQYQAAGGKLVNADGAPALDRDPLVAVLHYYERGVENGLFSPALLQYTRFDEYWNHFASAEANLIGVDSATYLAHQTTVQNVGLAPIPTLGGLPITALDGWMWVVTTNDPDRQQQALVFLSWMMRISQQSSYTEAFGVLPSQHRALRLWNDEQYAEFAQMLIAAGQLIPLSQRNNNAALALQSGLADVLNGATADTAADAALAMLAE